MKTEAALRDKDRLVLTIIVEEYVREGRPVSSGSVARHRSVSDSPATVRNVMAKLERLGYLSQPHTSAGRVPTDLGFRHYVNTILETEQRSGQPENVRVLQEAATTRRFDFDSLLSRTSKVLADSSDNLGFVISPRVSRVQFQSLRLVKISDERVLLIIITPFNMVLTESVPAGLGLSQLELDRAAHFICEIFRGRTLYEVRDALIEELPRYKLKLEDMLNKLMDIVRASIDAEEGEDRIYLQGAARLLEKVGGPDMNKLRFLFQTFEERARLVKLLSEFISLDRVKVLIGSEVAIPDIRDFSLVLSHYGYKNQVLGSLGIIGPKRLPYDRIIPLVDRVARRLSQAIAVCSKEVSL